MTSATKSGSAANVENALGKVGAKLTDIVHMRQWLTSRDIVSAYLAVSKEIIHHQPTAMLSVVNWLVWPNLRGGSRSHRGPAGMSDQSTKITARASTPASSSSARVRPDSCLSAPTGIPLPRRKEPRARERLPGR
jgi:hypothetical protein